VNLLDLKPRREVEWEEREEGTIVLVRRRPVIRGPRSFGRWISYMMSTPRVRLDDVGSFAWSKLDGHTTVGGVVDQVRKHFGKRVEPVEHRLGELVRQLRRERFLSYPEIDDRS
jgi:hypothetical protein